MGAILPHFDTACSQKMNKGNSIVIVRNVSDTFFPVNADRDFLCHIVCVSWGHEGSAKQFQRC